MRYQAFCVTHSGQLVAADFKGWNSFCASDQAGRWLDVVDVEDSDVAELEQLLLPLKPHHLVLERCLTVTHIPVVICYPNLLYLEFPVELVVEQRVHAYLSILAVPGLLVTIRRGVIEDLDFVTGELTDCERLIQPGVSGLLYHILDHLVDMKIQSVLELRNKALELSSNQDANLIDNHSKIASVLLKHGSMLNSVIEEALYCVTELHKIDACLLSNGDLNAYIDDLTANLEYAQRMMYRIEARLKEVQNQAHLAMQERSEYRLRILTVVTTIFLPLTLISGLFGMNIHSLPGVDHPSTFYILIGVMIGFTIALMAYFSRKGWFR
jgi:magnesium transporter